MDKAIDFLQALIALFLVVVIYGGFFAFLALMTPPGWIFLAWLLFGN